MHRGMRPASDPVDIADFETSVGDGVAACIYRQIEGVDFRLAVHLRHAGERDHAILIEISGHSLRPAETAEQRRRHAARNADRKSAELGTCVSVSVDLGGSGMIKTKIQNKNLSID